jgi:hypothetical protein
MDEQNCKTLCIPRTDVNISEPFVRNLFNKLNIGSIGRIDLVKKQNEKGCQYMRIFIHMNKWYNTENSLIAKERLLNGKDIKIIYEDPWFWKISVYKAPVSSHVPVSNSVCPPLPVYNKSSYKKENQDENDNWRKPRK